MPIFLIRRNSYFQCCCVFLFAAVIMVAFMPCMASAATAKQKYYAAERCYLQLRNNPNHQKYRDRWLRCIKKYTAVHRHNPRGEWAAAGLYYSGVLYARLYERSRLGADKKEAVDIFNRVIRGYPKSSYRKKAFKAKAALKKNNSIPRAIAHKVSARTPFKRAQANFNKLQKDQRLRAYRDQWMKSIQDYKKAYGLEPKGPLAAASLFGLALCYDELHHYSRRSSDLEKAHQYYRQLIREFPESAYADRAGSALPEHDGYAKEATDDIAKVIHVSGGGRAHNNKEQPIASSASPATVHALRFWSNPRYTRVVIDADKDTQFTYRELREDPSKGKPQRIYIDVHNSRLGKNIQKVVPINDNLLSDARAGQYEKDTVRVVVDIKSFKTFKIFSLKNPYRVVLDVWGMEKETVAKKPDAKAPPSVKIKPNDLVKQLALQVRHVVIDPGHGGKDYGAPGYLKGVHEKKVVLQIAKRLKTMIEDQLKCKVSLTRSTDIFLSLEERTAIANTKNADLFISIHTNANRNRRIYGTETYILNLATDDEAVRVAAMENAISKRSIGDLATILQDLMTNAKVQESTRLGAFVQQAMSTRLKKKYKHVRNKGLKQAPFYVLLGADMPSILIETAFISNPRECKRLTSKSYQKQMCQGIVDGIKRYMEQTSPTALKSIKRGRGS